MGGFIVRVSHVGAAPRGASQVPQDVTPELARAIKRAAEVTRRRWAGESLDNQRIAHEEAKVHGHVNGRRRPRRENNPSFQNADELAAEFYLLHEKYEILSEHYQDAQRTQEREKISQQIQKVRRLREEVFRKLDKLGLVVEIIRIK